MNIRFNKVEIENFRSIDKASVELADRGTIIVKGINEYEDKATSNGSGKSSLFEAIVFALFDETSSGEKDVANRITNKGYSVTLDFNIDAIHYVITRFSQSNKPSVILHKDDQDISARNKTDTNKLILQILGINKSIFLDSIFLSQGAQTNLATLSPTARKERLEILTNTDYTINQFKDKLKEKQTEFEANCVKAKLDLSSIDGKVSMLESQKRDIEDSIAKIDAQIAKRNALGNLDDIDNEIETSKKNMEIQNNDLEQREQEILDYEDRISEFRKTGDKNQLSRDELNSKLTEKREICANIQNNIDTLNMQINQCRKEINRLNREIDRIKNSDTCPTCGRKYENVNESHIAETINELQNNIELENNKIAEKNREMNSEQEKLNMVIQEGKNLRAEADALDEKINEFKSELNLMEEHKKELTNSKQQISNNIKELQTVINNLRNKKDLIMQIEVGNKDEFFNMLKDLEENELKISEEKEVAMSSYNKNNELCDVTKNSIQLVTKEFRTYLLQSSIQYLNKVLDEYSKELFSNSKDIITISGDDTKLDIALGDATYESLSGGEKTRVNIALLLAQKSLANVVGNISCNVIILDEVLGYCDSQAEENVISLISKELSNLETIFFVSHKEIAIGYDGQLVVVKGKDGLSRVKSY